VTTIDKLPDFEGTPVAYSSVKFSGTATGFSEGLKIAPVVLRNGQDVFFVVRATVAAVDHPLDKDEHTFRRHDLKIADMAPVSEDVAGKALQEYAQEIERIKAEADGQLMLDAEAEAEAREELDGTGTPAEVAHAAAARAKS
jgi:hypothetical protein